MCPVASALFIVNLMKLVLVGSHILYINAASAKMYSVHSFIWESICVFPLRGSLTVALCSSPGQRLAASPFLLMHFLTFISHPQFFKTDSACTLESSLSN